MLKKALLILVILIILIGAGIIYLNQVYLPKKVKSLITAGVEEATGRKVSLGSIKINIFKGLVLRNLIVYDDDKPVLAVKEISCGIIFPELLSRKIVIPVVNCEYPTLFLKRDKDGLFNVAELFRRRAPPDQEKKKTGFGVIVFKVDIDKGFINFEDDTFDPPFTALVRDIDLNLYLSLPANLKFTLKARYPSDIPAVLSAVGGFDLRKNKLLAKLTFRDLSPKDFTPYYKNLGVSSSTGLLDGLLNLQLEKNILSGDLSVKSENLVLNRGKLLLRLNSDIKSSFSYGLQENKLIFSGKAHVLDTQLKGLAVADHIKAISGEVNFNEGGAWCDSLSAEFQQNPVRASAKVTDFKSPVFSLQAASELTLEQAAAILKEKLNLRLPGELKGRGRLTFLLNSGAAPQGGLNFGGYMDFIDGMFKPDKLKNPLEKINGRLEFGPNQLKWQGLGFRFLGTPYKASGILTNFAMPGVQLDLVSPDLSLQSLFSVNKGVLNFSKFSGRFRRSDFSLQGRLDTASAGHLEAVVSGGLDVELTDIRPFFPKLEEKLNKANPQGRVHAVVDLEGDVLSPRSCIVNAKLSSLSLTAYGLKFQEFFMNLSQGNGVLEVPLLHTSCYGGKIDGTASLDLNKEGYPFKAGLAVDSVRIEELKNDTPIKDKDISGTIKIEANVEGPAKNIQALTGSGNIFISEGRLWELNLFKGLGSLVFAKDFAKIVFKEGSCSFLIQDKAVSTQDLRLKSSVADLAGPVKIGFDGSLDASLNVEVISEMVPLTGTFKDITTAVIGNATRFGVIRLSGTVKEPKYKFNTAVVDILKGLKDTLFGN